MRNFVYSRVKNRADAEDLTQIVFAEFLGKMGEMNCEDPETVYRWLRMTAAYRMRDAWRQEKRRREIEAKLLQERKLSPGMERAAASPEEVLMQNERILCYREMLEAVRKECPEEVSMLLRRERDGEELREIAEDHGISVPALYTRLYRLKRRLREERDRRTEQ